MLIAGTGSNCVLVNPLNEKLKSLDQIEYIYAGGWGSVLGDEGSGKFKHTNNFVVSRAVFS